MQLRRLLFTVIAIIAGAFAVQGQTGCMIDTACNYDPFATESDGSCIWTVDCNGTCGGSFIIDECNNCFDPLGGDEEIVFDFSGSIEFWTVPEGVSEVTIEAIGAQGGNSCSRTGGLGARMIGTFDVTQGDELKILAGEKAPDISSAAGGGGGSFVATIDDTPLLVAGGGSGATCGSDGNPGLTTENGADGDNCVGTGGTNGNGGDDANACGNGAGGGGGFFTNGQDDSSYGSGYGRAFVNGGAGGPSVSGGARGGFGGGTGTHSSNTGGGAGGGYSGGGAPQHGNGYSGGGGGSFNAGIEVLAEEGVNTGNGQVIISYSTIPLCNPGCDDPEADNFDPEANFNDGSCTYDLGCIDELACNYDPIATIDDGTCIFEIDCAGTCGGIFFEDNCGNCYDPNTSGEAIFEYTGSIVSWEVPENAVYTIEAYGAQGGTVNANNVGGLGAAMRGEFTLTAGETLQILVGQAGLDPNDPQYDGGGGGGGTFVALGADYTTATPMIVAGGGGGATAWYQGVNQPGQGGLTTNNGTQNGGGSGSYSDSGGAGFTGNSTAAGNARSFINGGQGGNSNYSGDGGFGGGGAAMHHPGGGGGGYNGGQGGINSGQTARGGGSFNDGANQINEPDFNEGNGYVMITFDVIPECDPGCTDPVACNYDEGAEFDDGSCILPDGCVDPTACNYDDTALCDDGTCILPDGCTDDTACNYDPNAQCDDGSCQFVIDCAGVCGGIFIEDECGNCFDPNSTESLTFNYTGSIEQWTVPVGVTEIQIEVFGAQGGGGGANSLTGGLGARMSGTFAVTGGEVFDILVGQQGGTNYDTNDPHGNENGGGGGSFVVLAADDTPYIIAGGGGGGPSTAYGTSCPRDVVPAHGQITEEGGDAVCSGTGQGGSAGNGGSRTGSYSGAAGGGFLTDGANGQAHCSTPQGGSSYLNGGAGGAGNTSCYGSTHYGGFGGGGAGELGSPGGGGGYSGGGAAGSWSSFSTYGGGGGSYNIGTDQNNESGVQEGDGQVIISYISIPDCVPGCTDAGADNYNPEANFDDGSCRYDLGCMDVSACNYDDTALEDDGSCLYLDCAGVCGGTFVEDECGNCFDPEATGEMIFEFTGDFETFEVPADGEYTIETWGAQGGNITSLYPIDGGLGGYAKGTITLNQGELIYVYVGGKGQDRSGDHPYGSCALAEGGWNGGGDTRTAGNGTPGGGASDIRIGGQALSDRVIVAGGGGGGGWTYARGGNGGGLTGENGTGSNQSGTGAQGGTQNAGGTAGTSGGSCGVTAGTFGVGGDASGSSAGGGGGGGGWYGGGGGGFADGGGGGSSYVDGLADTEVLAGVREGNGQVIITYNSIPVCVPGCTDAVADNYNPEANFDDGSCSYDLGCTDEAACNYDPIAITDDGTCAYELDCAGVCGGTFIEDLCGNCFDGASPSGEFSFEYTGSIESWEAPIDGTYTIEAYGGQGGTVNANNVGGMGAAIRGEFTLTAGETLQILVGQEGLPPANTNNEGGGGGGGSFVALGADYTTATPMIVAGGGGGGTASYQGVNQPGQGGLTTNNGTQNGGSSGSYSDSGGAGFTGNSTSGGNARSFINGGQGGNSNYSGDGGFGGGGASIHHPGGGGGGYNGGQGGYNSSTTARGGGSYNDGANQNNEPDFNEGDGYVIISYGVAPPDCIGGCTDDTACNYNAAAGYDDGSCVFDDGNIYLECPEDISVVGEVGQDAVVINYDMPVLFGTCEEPSTGGDLTEVLNVFDTNYSNFLADLGSTYNFSYDGGSNSIGDGGGDMYDGGNILNTNLGSGFNYTGGVVTPNVGFGPSGQYVTSQQPGMFMMAADLDGIDWFEITGNLGADNSGSVTGFEFTSGDYTGYYKRVCSAGDPSVNQLFLVDTSVGATQTFAANTDNNQHRISGLSSANQIIYVLWAGNSGFCYAEPAVQQLMDNLVSVLPIGNPELTSGFESGQEFPAGTTTVTWEFTTEDGSVYPCSFEVNVELPDWGCTDPLACNYEPEVLNDDGSCIPGGCLDEAACNYDPNAPCDNGTCSYELDCAGICGGVFVEDLCGNCFDPNSTESLTFNYTGSIEQWTVPVGITEIQIEVFGAQGGGGGANSLTGGLGARMSGTFAVTPGEVFDILVGQQGGTNYDTSDPHGNENGGGGGSFVVLAADDTPYIIAGGGGGGPSTAYGTSCPRDIVPAHGQITEEGGDAVCSGTGSGGSSGNGGSTNNGANIGAAGGGFNGNGANGASHCSTFPGGQSYLSGGAGGSGGSCYGNTNFGGFGGGGAGGLGSPGGGGGYSGGGAAGSWSSFSTYGGGGGSYNTGTDQNNESGVQEGDGLVVITYSLVPVCNEGCTDPLACNYDDTADVDDGSCLLPDGCTDETACNFDPAATCDDGTCILPDGCTDGAACNFDPNAICDDGSCAFVIDCAGVCGGSFIEDACGNCYDPNAQNDAITFTYNGSIETWTVPEGISAVTIEARGAQGGNSGYGTGGLGALIQGLVSVSPGEQLKVLVGEQGLGNSDGGGGGGGSFVTRSDDTPLVIAGGGGGAGGYGSSPQPLNQDGNNASTTETGNDSQPNSGQWFLADGLGGSAGQGGTGGESHRPGGGGGGLLTNGTQYTAGHGGGSYGRFGSAFVNGGSFGVDEDNSTGGRGGFGGGGGAGLGGGGGGGYSGGGGGTWSNVNWGHGGGGGGSYNGGTDQYAEAGVQSGNGQIIITYTSIPVCNEGCTDPLACNYDDTADVDDGSCLLPDGCTDETACNFDPAATCDDGTCILPDGCTDGAACNYDPNAICDDGSCAFVIDCAGTCGGAFIEDECGNCYDPNVADEQVVFVYTGSIETWTVPEGVTEVTIEALGAQGGGGGANSLTGGLGASMSGTFVVTPGEVFDILVGQQGGTGSDTSDPHGNENGGGGGSFVVLAADDTPYIIAGGGGGGPSTIYGTSCARDLTAAHGQITEDGADAVCSGTGQGGSAGNGGSRTGSYSGGAGGGFLTNGANGQAQCGTPQGGSSYLNGGAGGAGNTSCYGSTHYGGFGGGGAGELGSPGGGGGYSGGGASGSWSSFSTYGGGGGSYNIGTDQNNESGVQEGDGQVTITYSTIPVCVPGCTDEVADNYNPEANFDDGSCSYDLGCIDEAACNFDPIAITDDGSCLYLDCAGICGGTSIEDECGNCYDPEANGGTTIVFTGSIEAWEVPADAVYTIEAYGAQGGTVNANNVGGLGAAMRGEFTLTAGETLQILVGQEGLPPANTNNEGGGGGGGTFVALGADYTTATPMIVAGGGGGATASYQGVNQPGQGGLTTNNGTQNGGGSGSYSDSGGAGFTGNSTAAGNARSFINGGQGGNSNYSGDGGFGGGGASIHHPGGGGGGYNGGQGGINFGQTARGGGSYNDGANQNNEPDFNEGDGYVIISFDLTPVCNPGCTDVTADNYDPEANFDNGTCEYLGCTDGAACNFDPEANVNDGSCIFFIDCAGNCGGSFISDECGNCFDPTDAGETFVFQYTGFMQTFVVPEGAAKLRIQAFGAEGGSWDGSGGGLGAHISGTFDVNAGEQLTLLVGGAGQNGDPNFRNAGGGGGTFITDISDTPWLVAGGGGGLSSTPINGNSNASVTENGYNGFSPSNPEFYGVGGTAGNGATNAATGEACGGNGAGILTDGEETQCTTMGTMTSGTAFVNGGEGGVAACGVQTAGGFGGGGGGGCLGTGGGGGYSGGGGSYGIGGNAGGGGSYNAGNDAVNLPAINAGDGQIIITILPEPDCTLGCTDPIADNYNPDATDDDGTCIISGCTDETAANYDANANNDDGSCLFPGCTYEGASNYDNTANVDDGSCIFDDCPAAAGCTDEAACNYNALAVDDDGSCILPDGCTDNNACNYDENALCDDGSCEYVTCVGCTDPMAENYDPAYTEDDGSCTYCESEVSFNTPLPDPVFIGTGLGADHSAVAQGCGINAGIMAHNRFTGQIVPVNNVYHAQTGESPMSGNDPTPDPGTAKWNFFFSVNLGSLTFEDVNVFLDVDFDPAVLPGNTYTANISEVMINEGLGGTSLVQDSQNIGFSYWQLIGDPNILPFDPFAEGQYDLTLRVVSQAGEEMINLPIHVVVDAPGCMDAVACNYDPTAIEDSGECNYDCHGCMYPDATNYDVAATYDDGSCEFEPAVQCGPDTYFDEELGMCMPVIDTCPQDLNEDGLINSSDLLNFLGAFGTNCE